MYGEFLNSASSRMRHTWAWRTQGGDRDHIVPKGYDVELRMRKPQLSDELRGVRSFPTVVSVQEKMAEYMLSLTLVYESNEHIMHSHGLVLAEKTGWWLSSEILITKRPGHAILASWAHQ